MKVSKLRSCGRSSCVARLQQERQEGKHLQTVETAENELYTGSASYKMESGDWTEIRPKDRMQKYLAARAKKRVEHVEHLQERKKRQFLGSTQIAVSQPSHSASLGGCDTSGLDNSCLSLVKLQRAPVYEVSCDGNKGIVGTENPIPIINTRATKKVSGSTHGRTGEEDNRFCTVTKNCDQVELNVTLRASLVPDPLPPARITHQECSFHLLKGQEGTLRRGTRCRHFSGESCPVSVRSLSVRAGCSWHHFGDTEASSLGQISESPLQQTSVHQKSLQDHTTSLSAKEMSEDTACHVKRRRSNQSGTAETSVREKNSPLSTWCVHNRDKKEGQPQFPQGSTGNSHFSQAYSNPIEPSEEYGGLHEPCDSCLFVHPCLLVPLLPPTSAFTNPCWPPTPSKKRRGLPDVSRGSQAVPGDLSETAADCKKCSFFNSVSRNQHHTSQSPCASARCSLRAFAELVASHNSPLSTSSRLHWVDHPDKVWVTNKLGHQSSGAPNFMEAASASRKREKEGKERKSIHLLQKSHCHKVEKNQCLIEAGHLIQCACCSPWLPIPSSQLMKKKHALGDGQAGCATPFVKSISCRDTHNEAMYSATATIQSSGHSAIEYCRTKRRDRCSRGLRHVVDVVSLSAEGRKEKYLGKLLHERTLSIRRQPPACDFAGKETVNITPKSLSQALPLCFDNAEQIRGGMLSCSASKKASNFDDWKGIPERKIRVDGLAGIDATVRRRGRVFFETLVPQELSQGRKDTTLLQRTSYKSNHLQEGQTPYSQSSPTAHEIIRKSSGTKRRTNRTGAESVKRAQADAHLQPPHPILAKQRSHLERVLHNDRSASVQRRPAMCALPPCNDRSLSKLSGPNGSVLLPSIGCGLTVAQSSLGRGSGLGLYAMRPFSVRSRISEYSGLCVDRKVAMLLRSMGTSTHVMRVGMQHQYLVGYRLPFLYGGAGAFVNDGRWYADGRRGPGVGARFQVVYDKKRARDRVYVVATRNIEAGEEIFTSYDNLYWALMG